MYAKIEDETVTEYPISFLELKKRFALLPDGRRISIPRGRDFAIDGASYVIVNRSTPPSKKYREITPVFVDGRWTQKFETLPYDKGELRAHNENTRERLINNGTVTFDNITVGTDSRTIQWFTGLMFGASNPDYVFPGYNAKSGTTDLTAAQIQGLFAAGTAYVSGLFDTYNAVEAKINNGTITTPAEIDSEYA